MEEVIEGGPWLFQGQPIVLQKWEPGSVWIKLRHLPVELWTIEGLSTVASGIGKPFTRYAITRACTRLDFARVCIMLDISSKLPKHIVIMVPREDGSETPCKVDVEYEWLPLKCTACMTLGHSSKGCPTKKPRQPPVSVYVQKPVVGTRGPREEPEQAAVPKTMVTAPFVGTKSVEREDKGKAIVLYNAFEMINAAIWNVRGLNRRDHQVSIANLVSEHRLQFIGLLETRVSVGNVARVQRGLLPRWNWFVDYVSPDNRIWLASHEDFIDLNVLKTGDQFVHCSAHICCLHVHVLLTIVYGVNDVVGRRVLWDDLDRISHTVRDVPWLVGGDFNTVVDVSEVCGISGDIQSAAEEFQGYLRNTGLITLPMQGEWFTWHNYSRDAWSLWKRLDRLLVNGWWLGCWPNTYYMSLHARTSDHSPLVLRGDNLGQSIGMFRFYKAASSVIGDEITGVVQEFFRTGRRISNNILLGQDIFHGYNHQNLPPRCALKVDLRKAYDTLEWDFVLAMLQLFGFPPMLIGWIQECISTPSFSISLNGLHANINRSQLILSKSAYPIWEQLLSILGFQEGCLPSATAQIGRHLGFKHVLNYGIYLAKRSSKVISDESAPNIIWSGVVAVFSKRRRLRSIQMWYTIEANRALEVAFTGCRPLHCRLAHMTIRGHPSAGIWNRTCALRTRRQPTPPSPVQGGQSPKDGKPKNKAVTSHIQYRVRTGDSFMVWHDPWHPQDFQPPGPKVDWYVLVLGPFRIPRNCFILWLAILGRLTMMDRTWWLGIDRACILCTSGETESHDHLFFQCNFSRACLRILHSKVRFQVPRLGWQHMITWASRRWRVIEPMDEDSDSDSIPEPDSQDPWDYGIEINIESPAASFHHGRPSASA
ncbi:UNVERIFIED_CONTAM: hypothetical protein Slati_0887700 [Sesamum latifolium]|uniref:Reverse transcriptase zinc-binding domain-containing protein n=1 Tax=Sesamum latifolium TaxID=2727402 RepID=A0AAW2XN62_9LAMI